MDRRTTVATAALGATLTLLTACGSADDAPSGSGPTPTSTASVLPTPEPEPTPSPTTPEPAAGDLAGTWRDDAADWTVELAADGRFVVDYQGYEDFLVGSWSVDGTTLTLTGDDGIAQTGQITETGLVFALGTLTRR